MVQTILATLRRAPRGGEVDDLRQMIYLRIIEKDYLRRTAQYIAAHGGSFTTSLVTLARNVVLNYISKQRRNPDEYPTNREIGMRHVADEMGYDLPNDYTDIPYTDERLRGFEASSFLDRVSLRCSPKVPARVILHYAREHGLHSGTLAGLTGIPASTIRHHLVHIRTHARQLREEERQPAWATLDSTTKSAPVS